MSNSNSKYTLELTKDELSIIQALRRINEGIIVRVARERASNVTVDTAANRAILQLTDDIAFIGRNWDRLRERAMIERDVLNDAYFNGYFIKSKKGVANEQAK